MFLEINFIHWLVILSIFVAASGSFAYIKDTAKGKTKPNRVSWSLWALAPMIGTAAALYSHADIWATTRIFLAGFLPLIVFTVSFFNPKSYWKLTTFDFICGACSVLALFIWWKANSPQLAILFAALGDGFASIPTIKKAWTNPETETGFTFLASLIAVILVLPSIPIWNIENSAFQIYLLVCNAIILLAIYRNKLFKFVHKSV